MSRVAIVTDSNSGITQEEAKKLGIAVLPKPFYINGNLYFEDIDLTQEQFYKALGEDAEISTSQPAPTDVTDMWDELLKEYDEVVHIPMSSGLSSSCQTAIMLSQDYDGRVQVVNNQRISVTQRQSVLDAVAMADKGYAAEQIKDRLEETKLDSSIYITLSTLYYLKKGGRITPAAAALGTLLKLKPVLQIQGEKLDAFSKCRTLKQAKQTMINAVMDDFKKRFGSSEKGENMYIEIAYSGEPDEGKAFYDEVKELFPDHDIVMAPLSLSVSCHIGPGAVALACVKKLEIYQPILLKNFHTIY